MKITFTKMQALGNDFVVLNAVSQDIPVTKKIIQQLADRHYGVGCDQVLMVTSAKNAKADFGYRIFNADGNEVYQCGNGARCVGLFIQQEKLTDKKTIYLETRYDLMRVEIFEEGQIQVDMAKPNFDPKSLPFVTKETSAPYHLQLNSYLIQFDVVSVGNPHCILQKNNFSSADIIAIGEQLNAHPAFPEGVNVGFVQYDARNQVQLCVYERGAGVTQACGSGACAAVAVGRKQGHLDVEVDVLQAGGKLHVSLKSLDAMMQLRGTATRVFEGIAHFDR